MSHNSGKIECVGLTEKNIYFRYQRAANNQNSARFMVFKRNPEAYWFDDYTELVDDGSVWEESNDDAWVADDMLNVV